MKHRVRIINNNTVTVKDDGVTHEKVFLHTYEPDCEPSVDCVGSHTVLRMQWKDKTVIRHVMSGNQFAIIESLDPKNYKGK